jgi:hypothetical protein
VKIVLYLKKEDTPKTSTAKPSFDPSKDYFTINNNLIRDKYQEVYQRLESKPQDESGGFASGIFDYLKENAFKLYNNAKISVEDIDFRVEHYRDGAEEPCSAAGICLDHLHLENWLAADRTDAADTDTPDKMLTPKTVGLQNLRAYSQAELLPQQKFSTMTEPEILDALGDRQNFYAENTETVLNLSSTLK